MNEIIDGSVKFLGKSKRSRETASKPPSGSPTDKPANGGELPTKLTPSTVKAHKLRKKKSNRLSFKRSKINQPTKKNDRPSPEDEHYEDLQKEMLKEPAKRAQPQYTPNAKKTTRRSNTISEWGPEINGYRFITTNPEEDERLFAAGEQTETSRSKLNGYFVDFTESEEETEDSSSASKYNSTSQGQSDDLADYRLYLNKWEQYFKTNADDIPTPIPVHSGLLRDVTATNLKLFLLTMENVKRERIRWHPDKMTNKLKRFDKIVEIELVTKIFQSINELYENFNNTV